MAEPHATYGGMGWICGNPHDYDREYCVDLLQLSAFLRATQPEAADSLGLSEDGPGADASSWRGYKGKSASAVPSMCFGTASSMGRTS